MKTLVVYTSQTGFTKRYAQWLAEKMDADIYDLKEVQKKADSSFAEYDAIVYAGWCMAGKVVKTNWFFEKAKNWKDKRLALIAVGGSPNDNPDVEVAMENMLTDEQKSYIKAFYCQGGFNHEKMNLPSKLAMKAFIATLRKSKNEKEREVASFIDHSYDISDIKFIEPVVAYLKGGNAA